MTGDNCTVVNCGTNRRTKGIGIFKLPSRKLHPVWQKEWLNETTKTTVNANFKNKTLTLYTPANDILQKKISRSINI